MEAIILAGGFGTRLAHIIKEVPKPMAPVANLPFIQYIFNDLIEKGVTKIIVAVGYKKDVIINYFGSSYRNVQIEYSSEEVPLYTGGAIKKASSLCLDEDVVIINGDTFFDINLRQMLDDHKIMDSDITVACKKMQDFDRYGQIIFNDSKQIVNFCEKQFCKSGYINAGIYIMKKHVIQKWPQDIFSFERDLMEASIKKIRISAYESQGYFIDIGVPEDYLKAQSDFKSNKTKAAFFDRDGTINVNLGYVFKPEDLEFIYGTCNIIRQYNDQKIPVIVITNQAGIAKKYYTKEQMDIFNMHLNQQLEKFFGAHIDQFYYCPHHPDYTGECDCRKPKPGLILKAAKEYNIDLSQSVFYGDKESDHMAALNAGIQEYHLVSCKKNI